MWDGARSSSILRILGFALWISPVGCGGGGGGSGVQPPPPQPDFQIGFSSNSVTVPQGGTSSPVTVSVTPENGFSGSVQITLTGLPSGATTNPQSPFSVAAGQGTSVIFGAASSTPVGQVSVTAQGVSGNLSHSAGVSLTIQSAIAQNLSRTTFVQNDSRAALDSPAGEPHRRQIVYDPAGQRFFVANRAMNRVEAFSASSPALLATIDAPGASSVDLSPDGTTLWVGTALEQILAISINSLQVIAQYSVAGVTPIPGTVFDRPEEVVPLSSGKLLVRLRQPAATEALLALWDPTANTFTNLTSAAPAVFQNGVGVVARSGDRSRVFVAANDSSGEVAFFDSAGNVLAGPQTLGAGNFSFAAANADGSNIGVIYTSAGVRNVLLLDAHLNPVASYSSPGAAALVFSLDGQTLFVAEILAGASVVTALSTANLKVLGQIPDIAIQGFPSIIQDADSSQMLCGLSNRGVSFLDASQPASLPSVNPVFAEAPAAQPAEGPSAGGTSVSLSGANFSSNVQLRFGSQNPISATVLSASQLQATSPASASPGPVNLTAYFSNGWLALAPSAFSFGPALTQILPNGGLSSGGESISMLGYGFGSSTGNLTVTIGGHSATVQKVETLPNFAAALRLDSTYPFSLERITLTTPAGTPGKVDVSISAPSGSTAAAKSFQFLRTVQIYPNPGLHKFVVYDQARSRVYLSATDHVDVFDLETQVFTSSIEPPPNGPPPDAALRGLSLTPDNSQLVVADFGAQSVYLINPDGMANNGAKVYVGGVAGFLDSGPARVAATGAQTVFVGLSGEGGSSGSCNACLGQMNLTASPPSYQPAPQPEVTSLVGAPLIQSSANGDIVYLAFASAPGGPVADWQSSSPNVFTLSTASDISSDLTTSADGTLFAMRSNGSTELRGSNLTLFSTPASPDLETIPNRVAVPGVALHPSGALLYEPFLDGPPPAAPPATGIRGGIDIRDVHSGRLRLRLYLPEPFAMLSTDLDGLHGSFLTLDENGQRLFALTTSGLTIVQLASVPLGIGTISPSAASASAGATLTIRGSGFQSATMASLGGKPATVTFTDMNTLLLTTPALAKGPQQLVLTNPDGETVALDAAFLAQ